MDLAMKSQWDGGEYDMLERNCCSCMATFSTAFFGDS